MINNQLQNFDHWAFHFCSSFCITKAATRALGGPWSILVFEVPDFPTLPFFRWMTRPQRYKVRKRAPMWSTTFRLPSLPYKALEQGIPLVNYKREEHLWGSGVESLYATKAHAWETEYVNDSQASSHLWLCMAIFRYLQGFSRGVAVGLNIVSHWRPDRMEE